MLDMFSLVEMGLEGLEERLHLQMDPLISVKKISKGMIMCSIQFIRVSSLSSPVIVNLYDKGFD